MHVRYITLILLIRGGGAARGDRDREVRDRRIGR